VPYFECRKLTRHPWIEDLDLVLEPGEIVLLRAPSGSGKTLLLRTIADLDPADGGEVLLQGRHRASFSPAAWRSRVLYLHQVAVRLPGSLLDNLRRIAELQAHAGRELSLPPDVPDPAAPVERLSGGEMQRFALRRALALDPAVLLLDEATSALDSAAARQAERAVADWAAGGRAVLWATHDASVGPRVGAREVSLA
jgi:phosphate-transporting ATPase